MEPALSDTQTRWPATAYCGAEAHDYDERRFMTPQGRLFSELENRQFEPVLRRLTVPARVLEIGCGTARFAAMLARRGFTVVATDPSADMIAVAMQNCAGLSNVSFEQAEGARLGYPDGAFDFVFAIRVVNQTESEDYALRMIREMIRLARSGGLVLVEFANRDRPLAKPSRDVRLSFGQVTRLADASGCEVVSRQGVLVFSQSVLDRVPNALVPLWGMVERGAAGVLRPWASRGYVLLRKR